MAAVLDRSPSVGARGEATLGTSRGWAFATSTSSAARRCSCGATRSGSERKVPTLDAQSRVAITISPYRRAMGPIALTALARYPHLTYVAQDLDTLSLLVDGIPLARRHAGLPPCRATRITRCSRSAGRGSTSTRGPGSTTSVTWTTCSGPASMARSLRSSRARPQPCSPTTRARSSSPATSTSRIACCATCAIRSIPPTSTRRRTSPRSTPGTGAPRDIPRVPRTMRARSRLRPRRRRRRLRAADRLDAVRRSGRGRDPVAMRPTCRRRPGASGHGRDGWP